MCTTIGGPPFSGIILIVTRHLWLVLTGLLDTLWNTWEALNELRKGLDHRSMFALFGAFKGLVWIIYRLY